MDNINEKICKAAQIIVQEQLKNLKFDITIECEIVGDERKKDGLYQAKYMGNKMDVYSFEKEYATRDRVYVLVPQGDFSNKKVILTKLHKQLG